MPVVAHKRPCADGAVADAAFSGSVAAQSACEAVQAVAERCGDAGGTHVVEDLRTYTKGS